MESDLETEALAHVSQAGGGSFSALPILGGANQLDESTFGPLLRRKNRSYPAESILVFRPRSAAGEISKRRAIHVAQHPHDRFAGWRGLPREANHLGDRGLVGIMSGCQLDNGHEVVDRRQAEVKADHYKRRSGQAFT